VALIFGLPHGGQAPVPYATGIAQTRQVDLVDGSHLFIGAKSAVAVRVDDHRREVDLQRGEAFFEVAKDRHRPFIVRAGDTVIRVVGTKFNVSRIGDEVRVNVLEGRVEVRKRPLVPFVSAAPERVLTRDQTPSAVEPGAWREGRMVYLEAPLRDVVADANRYSSHPIRLDGDEVGDLRVTVTFRTATVDDLIDNLGRGLPIRVERQPDGSVVIKPE